MSQYTTLCLMLVLILALSANSSLAQSGATSKSLDELKAEVESKLDLGNPYIADTAMTIAADYPGEYNINQVSQIYRTMASGGWYYVNDPSGSESYQNANLSLQKGKIKNTIGMGDCDDFAILMTSLVQSISGSARVIFAYDIDNQSGHAYSELYLGKNETSEVNKTIDWLKNEYGVANLPGITKTGDEVWLNLDWGNDITKAAYPGGSYFGGESKNVIKNIMWQSLPDQLKSPIVVPVIDSMDNTEGWQTINDGKGSSISISTTPGKKGNGLQLSYDLKEGGWVGISKDIDSSLLSEVAGLNFSYFMIEKKNTINLNLVYDDGTTFGVSWSKLKTDIWSSQKALYSGYNCLSPSDKCLLYKNSLETNKVKKIEFIISNKPENSDIAGSGIIVLDQLQGTMAIPEGSPWARAEEKRRESLAIDLATRADRLAGTGDILTLKALIATEALRLYSCWQTDRVLRSALELLPRSPALERVLKQEDNVNAVTFSPDGTKMAITSNSLKASNNYAKDENSKNVRLLELKSGKELVRLHHDDFVNSAAFSPDGKKVATASDDNTSRIWDVQSGRELIRLDHDDRVGAVAFNPEGKILATAEKTSYPLTKGAAMLWNAETGELLARMDHDIPVVSVIFGPNGQKLGTTCWDGSVNRIKKIRIWEVPTGKELLKLDNNEALLAFSPDGSKLITLGVDDAIRVRDATSGAEYVKMQDEDVGYAWAWALSPDGSKLAVENKNSARIWDINAGREMFKISHNDWINKISFAPDGSKLATASRDGTVRLWDAKSGRELVRIYCGNSVLVAAFSPDGNKLVVASSSGVNIWNVLDIRRIDRIEQDAKVYDVAFSPDGSRLAIGESSNASVRDVRSGSELISKALLAPGALSVSFSPDGSKLAIGTIFAGIRLLDASSMNEIGKIHFEFNATPCVPGPGKGCYDETFSIFSVDFSQDGSKLAWASDDKTARIWDIASGKEQARLRHNGTVYSISFSPDGSKLATASDDGNARLWEVASNDLLAKVGLDGSAKAIDYSPDGSKIAVASGNKTVSIWDSRLTNQLKRIEQEGPVRALAFSNDSMYLATGSDDKTARIWDLESGREIARIEHDGAVRSVDFSPKGSELASASDDGVIRISLWRPEDMMAEACCRLSRNLTLEEWRQYMGDEPYQETCKYNSCTSSPTSQSELANASSLNLSQSILKTKERLMRTRELL